MSLWFRKKIQILLRQIIPVPRNLDYLIVLGAHVDGTRLTKALLERTRRAFRYLQENPKTKAVLSGAQGTGEAVSEAQAMYRYLVEKGIDPQRLLLEEKSCNTSQNMKYSLEITGLDVSVGVVTNHFHVLRGVAIGKKCRCRQIYAVPAPYCSWRLFFYIPREILAVIKDKILGNL